MKKFLLVLLAAVVPSLIIACGDDDNANPSDSGSDTDTDTDSDTDISVTLSAATADGPCGAGSTYTATELGPDFQPVDSVDGSTDSLGRITGLTLKAETAYDVSIVCYDFNEITGKLSDSTVTLHAFIVTPTAGEVQGSITDISQFLSDYVLKTYKDTEIPVGEAYNTYLAINTAAFTTLVSQLDFLVMTESCDPANLDIVSGSSACNDTALAVELVVRNFVVNQAIATDQPETSLLQNTLNAIKFAFSDGDLSDFAQLAELSASVSTLDVLTAQTNLSEYLTPFGGTAPTANTVLDTDRDGVPNATDPDIDGDGMMNAEDGEYQYNPLVTGGAFIGYDNGLIWEHMPPNEYLLQGEAYAYCDSLVLAGYDDWHLPTLNELRSLIVGCEATEPDGSCGLTDECAENSCGGDNCNGCTPLPADNSEGMYYNSELGGWWEDTEFQPYWTNVMVEANPARYFIVDFRKAQVSSGENYPADGYNLFRFRCVRTL